ncbi:MAG: hypothetical protein Q8S13_01575 [Dehalococcoidia bacterium]|nr:hypothetical protein [Dehalococcoidia bacterium]
MRPLTASELEAALRTLLPKLQPNRVLDGRAPTPPMPWRLPPEPFVRVRAHLAKDGNR